MKKSTKHLPRESLGDSYNSAVNPILTRGADYAHLITNSYFMLETVTSLKSSIVCQVISSETSLETDG
jgi:hypothetical protein